MKHFQKGDAVTYICNWDRKGTFMFQHAVVYSCGHKEMILTDAESGTEMGRNYKPRIGMVEGAFPRLTDEKAAAYCIKAGNAFIPFSIAGAERAIAANKKRYGPDPGYANAVRKDHAYMLEHGGQAYHHQDGRPIIRNS